MALSMGAEHARRVIRLAGVMCAMATLGFCGFPDIYANVYYLNHTDITKIPVHVIKSVRSRIECVESCIRSPKCFSVLHGDMASSRKQCLHLEGILTVRTETVFMRSPDMTSRADVSAFVAIDSSSVEYEAAQTSSSTATTSLATTQPATTTATASSSEATTVSTALTKTTATQNQEGVGILQPVA